MKIRREPFGKTKDGIPVEVYTLENAAGMLVRITNFGASIISLEVPDKNGLPDDVVLGFDNLSAYEENTAYIGAVVGRFANRIANGKFSLDGKEYQLTQNENTNTLHGGSVGFDKKVWHARPIEKDDCCGVELNYTSKANEEGFPGELRVTVTYVLGLSNELQIHYAASADAATPVNLTQHSYFNLGGTNSENILNNIVSINASHFLPVNQNLIPTGELKSVADTIFDFRKPLPIEGRKTMENDQIVRTGGYDHCWVIDDFDRQNKFAARVEHPQTGRILEVYTDLPGMQFYTGNMLNGKLTGRYGRQFNKHTALALEAQFFPDSPNKADFPSTILRPGKEYRHFTTWRFSVNTM